MSFYYYDVYKVEETWYRTNFRNERFNRSYEHNYTSLIGYGTWNFTSDKGFVLKDYGKKLETDGQCILGGGISATIYTDSGWAYEWVCDYDTKYGEIRGKYIKTIIGMDGEYPNDGKHTDGFWYVKGEPAPPDSGRISTLQIKINNRLIKASKIYLKINNTLKEMDKAWCKINNSLYEIAFVKKLMGLFEVKYTVEHPYYGGTINYDITQNKISLYAKGGEPGYNLDRTTQINLDLIHRIDLTEYSSLKIKCDNDFLFTEKAFGQIAVTNVKNTSWENDNIKYTRFTSIPSNGEIELDISEFEGVFNLKISCVGYSDDLAVGKSRGTARFNILDVWLE